MTQATIETQYKDLNSLASRLRASGAVISVSKLRDDIFSINLKQLPKTSTVEEIIGIETEDKKKSDNVKATKHSKPKTTKKAAKQPTKPEAEDTKVNDDEIPF